MSESDIADAITTGDALLKLGDVGWPAPEDFKSDKLLILLHGFTAHGSYLTEFGEFFAKFGYRVFIFNYNSYRGITKAAESLKDFLVRYDRLTHGEILNRRVFLVAHSMGGLVARCLALMPDVSGMIRGIVMLGTPNNGTLNDSRLVSYFVDFGEYLTGAMPEARNPACLSAKELIRSDVSDGHSTIDRLNANWISSASIPPSISVSGGRRYLVVGKNKLKNILVNRLIQTAFGDQDNDGLVPEKSVNMYSEILPEPHDNYIHYNSYPYYSVLNHSSLIKNQTLALEIIEWLDKR